MSTQQIFPSTSLRQDFPTIDAARSFISRTCPANWAIVIGTDGMLWVTPEQYGLALQKAGYQVLASSSLVETEFKRWFKRMKAALIADARFTAADLKDRGLKAYAFVDFFHKGLSAQESAGGYVAAV